MLLGSARNTDFFKKSSATGFQDHLATVIYSKVQVFMAEVVHCGSFGGGFVLSPHSVVTAYSHVSMQYQTLKIQNYFRKRNGIMI